MNWAVRCGNRLRAGFQWWLGRTEDEATEHTRAMSRNSNTQLSPDRSRLTRGREDILTVDCFGTLCDCRCTSVACGVGSGQSRGLPGQALEVDSRAEPFDYWFWPWVGRSPMSFFVWVPQLVIIELTVPLALKQGGDAVHDRENEGERTLDAIRSTCPVGESGNQLVEEWRCFASFRVCTIPKACASDRGVRRVPCLSGRRKGWSAS